MSATKEPLTRDQMAAIVAQHFEPGWLINLGVGIPALASNFLTPDADVILTGENGILGYGPLAAEGQEDWDLVNGGALYVTETPGTAIVHHADSFALIRRGLLDCVVLGAYQVAQDGSFANWNPSGDAASGLGGIGGAMDLAAGARRLFITMEHTTRDGRPRLLERCTLPVTAPSGVGLVVTSLGEFAVRSGRFELLRHAPGYTVEEIQAVTGVPLVISPSLCPVAV